MVLNILIDLYQEMFAYQCLIKCSLQQKLILFFSLKLSTELWIGTHIKVRRPNPLIASVTPPAKITSIKPFLLSSSLMMSEKWLEKVVRHVLWRFMSS